METPSSCRCARRLRHRRHRDAVASWQALWFLFRDTFMSIENLLQNLLVSQMSLRILQLIEMATEKIIATGKTVLVR